MNGNERMKAVLSGEIPDQVPFLPTVYTSHACIACGYRVEEGIINPVLGTECMLRAALKYRADAVRFPLGPERRWYEEKRVIEEDGMLVQYDQASGVRDGVYDVDGGGAFLPESPPPALENIDDVEAIDVPDSAYYLEQGCLTDVKRCVEQAHENNLFTVGMCSAQTINFMVQQMGSAEAALLCFYDNPDMARRLIAKAVATSIEMIRAFVQIDVDCIYIGDSYASASVVSPEVYEEFCAPAYKRVVEEVHSLGVFCYKHCCGSYNALLERLPAIGIDAMDGIDPTSGMSVAHTKSVIGDRLTLMGGISCLTLLNGSPDEVYEEARQCIAAGKPGGRYVLGSACAVPPQSPPENLLAARRAIDDFGVY